MYFELFVAAALYSVGAVVFGCFEEGTPLARRLRKLATFLGVTALLSAYAGRVWALGWVLGSMAAGLAFHVWWTRTHGIGVLSAEPRDRYRALRGWAE